MGNSDVRVAAGLPEIYKHGNTREAQLFSAVTLSTASVDSLETPGYPPLYFATSY